MTAQQIVNCIGLTFDIVGVLILFKYGLPADVSKNGSIGLILEQTDKKAIDKWNKYNICSRIDLGLIIVGFLFQIYSNCL